ncbi:MAG: glycosyltransferase, partial [Actinomycetota bacterium]|nr:glycosyltransferase [Actinomycetota bacterium]
MKLQCPTGEVFIVDNSRTIEPQRVPCDVRVLPADNVGYAAAVNLAVDHARPDWSHVVVLTQDVGSRPALLEALLGTFRDNTVGLVGCVLTSDGRVWSRGGAVTRLGAAKHLGAWAVGGSRKGQRPIDWVDGAVLAMSRA